MAGKSQAKQFAPGSRDPETEISFLATSAQIAQWDLFDHRQDQD
jgi:hypothetical protein